MGISKARNRRVRAGSDGTKEGWIKCKLERTIKNATRITVTDKRGHKRTITTLNSSVKVVGKQRYVRASLFSCGDEMCAHFICDEEHRSFVVRQEDLLDES